MTKSWRDVQLPPLHVPELSPPYAWIVAWLLMIEPGWPATLCAMAKQASATATDFTILSCLSYSWFEL